MYKRQVYDDVMQSPTGKIAHWDYVAHRKGAAAVLPVLEDGRILMVRQYRNALDRETLEIPAGSRDSTEEATSVCAAREPVSYTHLSCKRLDTISAMRAILLRPITFPFGTYATVTFISYINAI